MLAFEDIVGLIIADDAVPQMKLMNPYLTEESIQRIFVGIWNPSAHRHIGHTTRALMQTKDLLGLLSSIHSKKNHQLSAKAAISQSKFKM